MKNLKENRNTFPNWMYCKKTEIDLSKSGTGLFPGAFYMNRTLKGDTSGLCGYSTGKHVQGMYKPERSYPSHGSGYWRVSI